MAVITKDLAITTKDDRGNQVLYHPFTTVDNVDNAVATVNGVQPDSQGNVSIPVPDTKTFAKKDDIYLYVGEHEPTELRENMLFINPNESNNIIMPSIKVGTVTKGDVPKVENVGTELNPVFNFTLPKGDKGEKGDNGRDGEMVHASSYVASVTESEGKVTVTKGDNTKTTFNAGLNILARNKRYEVGDIAYSPSLPSWAYLECIKAGTTGSTEPAFEKLTKFKDGTVLWKIRKYGTIRSINEEQPNDAGDLDITDLISTMHCSSADTANNLSASGNNLGMLLWDWLHRYGNNYVPPDTSNEGWNSLGICIIYYTENIINNQPSQYGQLINIPATKIGESMQIWIEQPSGIIFSRGGNGSILVNNEQFVLRG